jgi:hypothetical protein
VRVAATAGVSWLPSFELTVDQAVGVALPALGIPSLDVGRVTLSARALPSQEGQGRWGFHGGLSVSVPLGARLALIGEGRYLYFQEQTLEWGRAQSTIPLPAAQEAIVREIESRLDAVEFNPTFFHVSVGLGIRF